MTQTTFQYVYPQTQGKAPDLVNHPPHYKAGGIETIDYIEAKQLGYHLGNCVKYLSRAAHKGSYLDDLRKARWYLNRAIAQAEEELNLAPECSSGK